MKTEAKIIFDQNSSPLILAAFGKAINEEGLIIDKSTGEPIETPEGDYIKGSEFGGIKKGSEIFYKNDLDSAMKLVEGEL